MRQRAACREAEAEARVSPGAMAAGGLSRSERKAAERVRRLREEQQRERLRQVRCRRPPRPASLARAALTVRPAPAGVAHPEEGGGRAQRGGGPASGRERGPGDRAAGPEPAARGAEAAAGGGKSCGSVGGPEPGGGARDGAGLTAVPGVSAGVR